MSHSKPVIWIVSVARRFGFLHPIVSRYAGIAEIVPVSIGLHDHDIDAICLRLRHERCDAIVASGNHAEALRQRTALPVVAANPSGFDLLDGLARARRITARIGILSYLDPIPELEAFSATFGCEIAHGTYGTEAEAAALLSGFKQSGIEAVIGSGFIVDLANDAGLHGVFAFSDRSLDALCESAVALGRQRCEERSAPNGVYLQAIMRYAMASDNRLQYGDQSGAAEDRDVDAYVAIHCEDLAQALREHKDTFSV